MAETSAVFPGTFDPLTNGHLDIIVRASAIFDAIYIAVLDNPAKQTLFSAEERLEIIQEELDSLQKRKHIHFSVHAFSGLLVDFVRAKGAKVIIRGLRATTDYEYEAQMALMNRHLSQGAGNMEEVETFFLMTREVNSYISSTIVKQAAALGGDIAHLVPSSAKKRLDAKYPHALKARQNKEFQKQ